MLVLDDMRFVDDAVVELRRPDHLEVRSVEKRRGAALPACHYAELLVALSASGLDIPVDVVVARDDDNVRGIGEDIRVLVEQLREGREAALLVAPGQVAA